MKHRKKLFLFLLVFSCLIFLLAACTEDKTANNNATTANIAPNNNKENNSNGQQSVFPRTITDAYRQIVIAEKPERIAIVHWGFPETLLTFDLNSIAIALPFTYEQSVLHSDVYRPYIDKLDELVIIGENEAINFEALLAYEPDLILAGSSLNASVENELKAIAPTIFLNEDEINIWTDWRSAMTFFAEVLGQEESATTFLQQFDTLVKEGQEKLDILDETVAFVQVREKVMWLQGVAFLSKYYDTLHLNAPEVEIMQQGEMLSLEGLIALDPDHLFLGYFNYSTPNLPTITDEWEKLSVWQQLSSVQNDQVYSINGELALGFGPIGEAYGIKAIVEALTKD